MRTSGNEPGGGFITMPHGSEMHCSGTDPTPGAPAAPMTQTHKFSPHSCLEYYNNTRSTPEHPGAPHSRHQSGRLANEKS